MALQERGADTRIAIIENLLRHPGQTEEELVANVGVSKSTIRVLIQRLLDHDLIAKERRDNGGKRGLGPFAYSLKAEVKSAEYIEKQLRELATKRAPKRPRARAHATTPARTPLAPPAPRARLYVIVKAGTNDAVLTKDGRMLRIEERALERVMSEYERVLKTKLESMTLESYFERYYPEFAKPGAQRPTW